jgi:hypothetical protein
MIFVTPTGTKTSTLKAAMGLLKKQVNPQDQQDVSSTACCSDSESSDIDCLVESLKASSLKLMSSDSDQVVTASASVPPTLPAKKRRARFALGRSQIFHVSTLEEISDIERQECWWGPKDFQAFIFSAKHSSHDARIAKGSNVVKAVDDAYNTATYLACTMQEHNMERELAQHKIVQFTAGLEAWACRPACCRGLEHWTSAKFYHARIDNMQEAKDVVMQLTHRQESADEIAKHYQESSRAARILARLRGHADYEASVAIVLKEEELAAAAQFIAY